MKRYVFKIETRRLAAGLRWGLRRSLAVDTRQDSKRNKRGKTRRDEGLHVRRWDGVGAASSWQPFFSGGGGSWEDGERRLRWSSSFGVSGYSFVVMRGG
jgi:hypothetical protein